MAQERGRGPLSNRILHVTESGMIKPVLIVIASLLLAQAAGAHPGHGEPGEGFTLTHHLTEPIHLLATLATLLLVVAAVKTWRHRRHARAASVG